ncbi:MAG TPA: tetratricopeptide repeat protein [Kofleriaceae bacterium]|nr:tetratricopeptide repeat protein [Kofleriaceae bacterium]
MKPGARVLLVSMVVAAGVGRGSGRVAAQPAGTPAAVPGPAPPSDCAVAGAAPDEALYNSGVCRERAGAPDEAIAAYQELRTRFPKSPLAARALARIGNLHARVADYAEAADALEEYARRYPAERDAADALADASYYRARLDDDAKAIADTTAFVRTCGAKQPAEAARAFFGLGAVYERRGKPDELVRHLQAYLRTYGAKGGGDRLVIAYARIGQLLWDESCPVKTVDGACFAVAPAHAAQCGPRSVRAVTVVTREPRKVKAAMVAFASAVATYEHAAGRFPDGDEAAARHAYAAARFGQAELDYEAFLALAVPAGLDFDPSHPAVAKRSTARFSSWLADKRRLGEKATAAYQRLVTDVKDPATSIAAAARAGQVSEAFADALLSAELPAPIRGSKDLVDAYCDALTEAAEPLEQHAIDGFAACLQTSSALGWAPPWSPLCERELGQLRPDEYPPSNELHAAPAAAASPFDLAPPIDSVP